MLQIWRTVRLSFRTEFVPVRFISNSLYTDVIERARMDTRLGDHGDDPEDGFGQGPSGSCFMDDVDGGGGGGGRGDSGQQEGQGRISADRQNARKTRRAAAMVFPRDT